MVIATALFAASFLSLAAWVKWLLLIGAAIGAFYCAVSILVSWIVYDWSPLCKWRWIAESLPEAPKTWALIHAGLDECSCSIRAMYPESDGHVLDVFDKDEMTEPSIIRARRHSGSVDASASDWRALPIADCSQDAIFLILSAHEFRSRQSRQAFFREVWRALKPGGTVILAEHLRDAANFLAFGPGFLHFWPRREWLTVAASAGLRIVQERKITPWVSVFAFERENVTA